MTFQLPTAILGRTGLRVTRLGIGGAYCETPEGYVAALDCGVNYVDTARAYRDGDDEKVVGEAIAGRRDELVLASKSQARTADGARRDLETSLTLLQTDHLDVWQVHYVNSEEDRELALDPNGVLAAARRARDEGLVRHIGVTGHKWPIIEQMVASGAFDTVLCWYNCAMREPEDTVFPEANKQGTGVVIMNATRNDKLFGGADDPPPEDFYRYVLSHPLVTVTIIGLRDVDRFRRVAEALSERATLNPDERARLEAYGARMRAAGKLAIE